MEAQGENAEDVFGAMEVEKQDLGDQSVAPVDQGADVDRENAAEMIQGQARRVQAASRVEDIRASKVESAVEAQGNGLLLMHRFPVCPSFFIFFFVTVVVILSFVVSSNSCPLYENCNFFFFLQFQRCQKVYRKFFVITQILKSKS